MSQPSNPLESLIINVLKERGFDNLSEANQKEFMPQFLMEAQRRLGLAVMSHLTESATTKMAEMMSAENTPAQWWDFWVANVPNFQNIVRDVLVEYVADLRK